MKLRAFADASFLDCPDTARSTGGFCIFFNGCLLAFESKRLPLVTLSRTKFQAFRDVMCGYRTYNDLISGDPETVSTVRRIAQRKLEEELEYVETDSVYSYRL